MRLSEHDFATTCFYCIEPAHSSEPARFSSRRSYLACHYGRYYGYPCSYPLLPVDHQLSISVHKPFCLNNVEPPRAIGSNAANSLILRHHLVRDQEVGGSNPLAPTKLCSNRRRTLPFPHRFDTRYLLRCDPAPGRSSIFNEVSWR